jgi:hypothetical protein
MKLFFSKNLNNIAIALVILSFYLLHAITPNWCDDYWYMSGTYGVASKSELFNEVWNNCVAHWYSDTGRLINLVSSVFLTLVPKWLYSILLTALLVAMIHYMHKLSDTKSRTLMQWIIIGGFALVLPWHDCMTCVIFSLNYVFTSTLMLFVLYRAMQLAKPEFNASKNYVIATLIAGYICGWTHEGFSVPLTIGLCAYALTIGLKNIPKRMLWLIASLILGIATFLVSPSIRVRINGVPNIIDYVYEAGVTGWFWRLITYNIIYFAFIFTLIASLINKKIKSILVGGNREKLAFIMLLLSATTFLMILFFTYYTGPRCGMCNEILSLIGTTYLLNIWMNEYSINIKRSYTVAIAVAVTFITLFINASAFSLQLKLNKERVYIMQQYVASPDGVVYCDLIPFNHGLIDSRTTARQFHDDWLQYCINMYVFHGDKSMLMEIRPENARPKSLVDEANVVNP